jgi:predicted  nucleic acid-binding Zn-ribbon protein
MKKIGILVALFVLFGIGANTVLALEPIVIPKKQLINSEAVKKWHDARCAKFAEKLDTKIAKIEEKKINHKNAYDNMVSRFETLINRLENKGYDVVQLKTDLATLKEKVAKFKEDAKALSEKFNSTRDNICADADAKIKTNLGETRELIQAVQKDAKEIRTFYQTEIRSDIRAVKNQKPENN